MEERTQKLLILVGEQGPRYEARDFKKIQNDIVESYIAGNNSTYNQNFIQLFRKVISMIPLKQHIYAGLVPYIYKYNQDLAIRIIDGVINDLQENIKCLNLYKSINLVIFLSELMNISFINSLNFLNLLQDISIFMENTKNQQHRQFLVHLITRTLPSYSYSLNEKVSHDFKKFIERVRKYCGSGKNMLFGWILQQYHKKNLTDFSMMNRLEIDFNQNQQLETNFKIQLIINENLSFESIQYYLPTIQNDKDGNKLYQQFIKTQAYIHLYNFEQIIESFTANKTYLNEKIQAYLKYYENSFINRFVIEILIGKSLKAKNSVVQPMIIVKLIEASLPGMWQSNNQQFVSFQQLTQNVLLHFFHKQSQNFDVNTLYRFTDVFSMIINNLPENTLWDWQKYVIDYNNKEQDQYKVRKVILKLLLQKISLLNDRYQPDPCLSIYHPPQMIRNQVKYKNIRDMEMYERFVEHIKNKADSEEIMSKFQEPLSDYQIFLQALLQKCSLSHTHLEILLSRYQGIFQKNKQEYDWTLITKIRSFWRKSLYHRLLYLSWVIQHGYCDFKSYVKYLSKVQTDNQEEQLWIKIQLNQLNKKFRSLLQNK